MPNLESQPLFILFILLTQYPIVTVGFYGSKDRLAEAITEDR
jgi:hypothetical protein